MLVTRERFGQGKEIRVRALTDQKIEGVTVSSGDTFDIDFGKAQYLRAIGRVELVNPIVDEVQLPKKAAR